MACACLQKQKYNAHNHYDDKWADHIHDTAMVPVPEFECLHSGLLKGKPSVNQSFLGLGVLSSTKGSSTGSCACGHRPDKSNKRPEQEKDNQLDSKSNGNMLKRCVIPTKKFFECHNVAFTGKNNYVIS